MAVPGVQIARQSCPQGRFEVLAADSAVLENLHEEPFDLVYSLEVIEHLYDPGSFLEGCFAALRSGGTFICSTPYHGYAKNMMLSLVDGWDKHASPLYGGGHIKFFSRKTLSYMVEKAGFFNLRFRGSGRLPYLWKSMLIAGTKP
jgi:2-polyprenyl-6-hydroxyphenyl methylase/3-demethylubiquinone-9 3-methyltransferase